VLGPSRVLSLYICLCETPFSFNLIPNYLCLILLYLLPILTILIAIDCQLIEAAPFVPEDTLPPLSAPSHEPMLRQRQELNPPVPKQTNSNAKCSSSSPYLTKDPEFKALFPPEKEDLMYPLHSRILPPNDKQYIPSINNSFRKAERERFVLTLDKYNPKIRAKLDQPFGKDNLSQCFHAEPCLRHVLLPLWKSGFLCRDQKSWAQLCVAYRPMATLRRLIKKYGDVDFNQLKGFNKPGWENETVLNEERKTMASAALLHFNGDAGDLVRWIGGTHVGAHRQTNNILKFLRGRINDDLWTELRRIYLSGLPRQCNAEASEKNFQAFYKYGNHSTVNLAPEKTYKTLVKYNKRGLNIIVDEDIVQFILNCHVTPQGIIDVDKPGKNPREIFDCSFRPEPWCFAINDWTTKKTEPPLTFMGAEMGLLVEMWNFRISYPTQELYLMDDDTTAAFQHIKFPPALVAMNTSRLCGVGVLSTGAHFGGCTTPSNWDPIALARRRLAQYLWSNKPNLRSYAKRFVPQVRLATPPTQEEVQKFARATPDIINKGVLGPTGKRQPPCYHTHVDDNCYLDIAESLQHTVDCSAISLYILLGFPSEVAFSALSLDKFHNYSNHYRQWIGRSFNTRDLTVGMMPSKRVELLSHLKEWIDVSSYTLLEVARMLGLLEFHTKYTLWARAWVFAISNAMRRYLKVRYFVILRNFKTSRLKEELRQQLPKAIQDRIPSLVAKEQAALLWNTQQKIPASEKIKAPLRRILFYVQFNENPWTEKIGKIIPRAVHILSRGDAAQTRGGGAYCARLYFWFDIEWPLEVFKGANECKPADAGYVHINCLEFIIVLLQIAAVIERLRSAPRTQIDAWFPNGLPDIPVLQVDTDNSTTEAWENKVTSSSDQGQRLISILAALTQDLDMNIKCEHLAGIKNGQADDISRGDFSLPLSTRVTQLLMKYPLMKHWDYFLPSPDLLQLIYSSLSSSSLPDHPRIPKPLGRFVPTESFISNSA
jgi:hypothetical protein